MKRFFQVLLTIALTLTFFNAGYNQDVMAQDTDYLQIIKDNEISTNDNLISNLQEETFIPNYSLDFVAPTGVWQDISKDEAPATFSNVSYKLKDNVIRVGNEVTDNIGTLGQTLSKKNIQKQKPQNIISSGGFINKDILDKAAELNNQKIEIGSIVVDESSGIAFKVGNPGVFENYFEADEELEELVEPVANSYSITTPHITELLQDFEIAQETINLTRGNIVSFGKDIEKNINFSFAQDFEEGPVISDERFDGGYDLESEKKFKKLSKNPLIALQFENQTFEVNLGSGDKVSLTLSGGVGIDNIELSGRYSSFKGYNISLSLEQESYLVVEFRVKVNQEVRIPLFGIDVNFGVGKVTGGLFLVIGIDGNIRLDIVAREYIPAEVGISGKTAFCVPVSVKPYFSKKIESDGDVTLTGKIDGTFKIGVIVDIEIFGLSLVGAGVLLGAGVGVEKDGAYLDVNLYGLLQIYAKFIGKHFNLINLKPSILRKTQTNTGIYVIKFVETFITPARVAGTIYQQPEDLDNPNIPAANLPYRVYVVPESIEVDLNDPQLFKNKSVRKYPQDSYAYTNEWGEFYQLEKDGIIIEDYDQIFIEILSDEGPLYSDVTLASLPFKDFTISFSDYFNNYAIGQVDPIRTIDWEDNNKKISYKPSYYNNKIVHISPYINNLNTFYYGGQATTLTDEQGNFDTRNVLDENNIPYFYIYPVIEENFPEGRVGAGGFLVSTDYNKASTSQGVSFTPRMSIAFSRVVIPRFDLAERIEEYGKIIDRMVYDEYIYIINNNGPRIVTNEQFRYYVRGFSTVDYSAAERVSENFLRADSIYADSWKKDTTPFNYYTIHALSNPSEDENGASLFKHRVTVEWVWQNHKNPVKITSPNHYMVSENIESTFEVTAQGYSPFKFSLENEPEGISIDKNTGLLKISEDVEARTYEFSIIAEEDRDLVWERFKTKPLIVDLYEGNDPSPPDKQKFTLLIQKEDGPDEDDLVAPIILEQDHEYQFEFIENYDYEIDVETYGSLPITYSLVVVNYPIPDEISIDENTGILTVKKGLAIGTYYIQINAKNEVGLDTQRSIIEIVKEEFKPTILDEDHNYQFEFSSPRESLTTKVRVTGDPIISFSLSSENIVIPSQIGIDKLSGELTFATGIPAGTYDFVIKATNHVGSDERKVTLKVNELLSAPKILDAPHEYTFTKYLSTVTTEEIEAFGSQPLTWTLKFTDDLDLSEYIEIDEDTGEITFKKGLEVGKYYFIIRVDNEVGYDERECSIEILKLPSFNTNKIDFQNLFFSPVLALEVGKEEITLNLQDLEIGNQLSIESNKLNSFTNSQQPLDFIQGFEYGMKETIIDYSVYDIEIKNKTTIRIDDPRDVYTNDRDSVNGALYIKWHAYPGVGLLPYVDNGQLVFKGGVGDKFVDESPLFEKYHYYESANQDNIETRRIISQLKTILKEEINNYESDSENELILIDEGLLESVINRFDNTVEIPLTYLNYGKVIDTMNAKVDSDVDLNLNEKTGTLINGEVFDTLMNHEKKNLNINQSNFQLSFEGKNIELKSENKLFNFAYQERSYYEEEIIKLLDLESDFFTFSFAHHGALPGKAIFRVLTTLTPGLKVNVYRYELETGEFLLIQENVLVQQDGFIEYESNQMSEYVATTQTIKDAKITESPIKEQLPQESFNLQWFLIIGLSLLVLMLIIFGIFKKRTRKI